MNWKMETVYIACAVAGGTVLVLQTVLLLFGAGDHDTEVHVDAGGIGHSGIGHSGSGEEHVQDVGFGLLSIRTVSAFLTFFGLTGWYGVGAGWAPLTTVVAALAGGSLMLFLVAWLLYMQRKLASSGTVDLKGAVGHSARVYLRIPEQNVGKGKITLTLQGRSVELNAFTNGDSIPTGSEVRVVRQVTGDTFEVESLHKSIQESKA